MKRPLAFVVIERAVLLKFGQCFLKTLLLILLKLKTEKTLHRNLVLEVFILACLEFCNVTLNDKL